MKDVKTDREKFEDWLDAKAKFCANCGTQETFDRHLFKKLCDCGGEFRVMSLQRAKQLSLKKTQKDKELKPLAVVDDRNDDPDYAAFKDI